MMWILREGIAKSWPDSIDTSCARGEWGFNPKYDLESMTKLMLDAIEAKEKQQNNLLIKYNVVNVSFTPSNYFYIRRSDFYLRVVT